MKKDPLIIAIDGGSGTGKSSSARLLAAKLNCLYVDTGTHYRAITWLLQHERIPYNDPVAIIQKLSEWKLDEEIIENVAHIKINHRRFDDAQLRSVEVNNESSNYAALAPIRKFLLHFQRSQAEIALLNGLEGVVMEGRDIGTNIFPQTPFKYFFKADKKVKAARRAKEGLLDVTDRRDFIDATQGQLKEAPGAVPVDTTNWNLEEVVEWLYQDITHKIKCRA